MKKFSKILLISLCVLVLLLSSSFITSLFSDDKVTLTKEEYARLKEIDTLLSNYEIPSTDKLAELFQVYDILKKRYYIEPDYTKVEEGAIRGLLQGLDDPYSVYFNPEEFAKYWEEDQGEYAGIGVQIQSKFEENICRITRVFKGSPAEEVGIKKGDILIKAGEVEVNPTTLQEAVDFIRGEIGTTVDITILRGEEEIPFTVERRKIHINLIESTMLEGNIGLIQLYEFSGTSGDEFKQIYDDLSAQGMKGLIIDLRDNPGGWVNNAQSIADVFIDNDVLCYFEYRDGSREYIRTKPGAKQMPLVVLINENSASASELLSGAFRDYGLAELVGSTTFGKGIAQEVQEIGANGAGLSYTVAQYFTPKGGQVHKEGISPDYEVELTDEEKLIDYDLGDPADKQLSKAIEVMQNKLKK